MEEIEFSSFNFEESLSGGLAAMGFKKPTPIQQQAIPVILDGKDLIGCAQTGTGKTAAFLLPVINDITKRNEEHDSISTLIIVPTRELAIQIDQQLEGFSYFTPVTSIAIYGGGDGSSYGREKDALTQGADMIIATPGRLISHLNLGYVDFTKVRTLILDEADRMLDMGFNDDIMKIVSFLPKERQSLFFSATMPPKIRKLTSVLLNDPLEINIAIAKPAKGLFHAAFIIYDGQKIALLKHLLKAKDLTAIIIFGSTKINVKNITRELKKTGFPAAEIHSDLSQDERERVLQEFRNKKLKALVATDILSRGIDIKGINLIINYDVPPDAPDYIHRIGRTARADSQGVAFTLVNEKDQYKFKQIEDMVGEEIRKIKLPDHIGEGPKYNPSANKGRGNWKKKSYKKRR